MLSIAISWWHLVVASISGQNGVDSGHSYNAPVVPPFTITAAAHSDILCRIRQSLWDAEMMVLQFCPRFNSFMRILT